MGKHARVLRLTAHEIDLIESALLYVYNRKMRSMDEFRGLMRKEEVVELTVSANAFANLQGDISGGVKDIKGE